MDPMGHDTVDGSEIRDSPVELGRISPLFSWNLVHSRRWSPHFRTINSIIVKDFSLDLLLESWFSSLWCIIDVLPFPSRFDVETRFQLVPIEFESKSRNHIKDFGMIRILVCSICTYIYHENQPHVGIYRMHPAWDITCNIWIHGVLACHS